ncbi:NYN domain-containing protein [Nitratireductor soli]|uniref:NYN domain-containing protein n=1 Tax=Nitratireductor soli TaxID=1670619 RepID=UPI0012F7A7E8|nr:NYN domain-containing protein [Nitratireductor soli]
MIRASFFIDGFNLYHALKRLNAPHLKWADLPKLMQRQISPKSERIADIFYFSAYAYWWPDRRRRHEEYVRALESSGVEIVLGHFKRKDGKCNSCGARWDAHEEKETDVNIALCILNEAYKDTYDRAYIVSRDSDLKPAIAMVKAQFPHKEVIVVAPPNLGHATDLIQVADAKRKISTLQVEQSLFPEFVIDAGGNVVAKRPAEYNPPK